MPMSHPESAERITVHIDRDFETIVPTFLSNRKKDIQTLRQALSSANFSTIEILGHRMKGDGGGYGFDRISEIGNAMEQAAIQHDHTTAEQCVAQLEDFLARLQVEYR
ncbi:MAG: Hpt domain-containing protein [Nitrospira sp.]|nr:Hpt domain-containing protein [Nitrospira sp.]